MSIKKVDIQNDEISVNFTSPQPVEITNPIEATILNPNLSVVFDTPQQVDVINNYQAQTLTYTKNDTDTQSLLVLTKPNGTDIWKLETVVMYVTTTTPTTFPNYYLLTSLNGLPIVCAADSIFSTTQSLSLNFKNLSIILGLTDYAQATLVFAGSVTYSLYVLATWSLAA